MFRVQDNLRLPDGTLAGNRDKMIVLNEWARHYASLHDDFIFAALGHPTYATNEHICKSNVDYWQEKEKEVVISSESLTAVEKPPIDPMAQKLMAEGLNRFYDLNLTPAKKEYALSYAGSLSSFLSRSQSDNEVQINPQNILFTLGGSGGLHTLFNVLRKQNPQGCIITPFPHYTLYAGINSENCLIPINLMESEGYRLTRYALEEAFTCAHQQGKAVNALLFCNPNNPLGTVLGKQEFQNIVEILAEKNQTCCIIFDEAYCEMFYQTQTKLWLEFLGEKIALAKNNTHGSIYKNLWERTIILRSATKSLSASGERMAAIINLNMSMEKSLLKENVRIGCPPQYAQIAYAFAVAKLQSRSSDVQLTSLRQHYETQVRFVENELKALGIYISNDHVVGGAFYVIIKLKALHNYKVENKEVLAQLSKIGLHLEDDRLTTDEHIAYYLIVKHNIAIIPLSYFGVDSKYHLRMTCSLGKNKLADIIARLKAEILSHQPFVPLLSPPMGLLRRTTSQPLSIRPDIAAGLAMPQSARTISDPLPASHVVNDGTEALPKREEYEEAIFSSFNPVVQIEGKSKEERKKKLERFLPAVNIARRTFAHFMHQFWSNIFSRSKLVLDIEKRDLENFFNKFKVEMKEVLKTLFDGRFLETAIKVCAHPVRTPFVTISAIVQPGCFEFYVKLTDFLGSKLAEEHLDERSSKIYAHFYKELLKNLRKLNALEAYYVGFIEDILRINNYLGEKCGIQIKMDNQRYPDLVIIDLQLRDILDIHIETFFNEQKEEIKKSALIQHLLELYCEKILYDFMNGDKGLFSRILAALWQRSKNTRDISPLVEEIVHKHASIDYGPVEGDLLYRNRMAIALRKWYPKSLAVEPSNILFTSGRPQTILSGVFKRYFSERRLTTVSSISSTIGTLSAQRQNLMAIWYSSCDYFVESALHLERVLKKLKYLKMILLNNPNCFLVLDEREIEISIFAKVLTNYHLLEELVKEKALIGRIIIIRGAETIFCDRNNDVSVIIVFDKNLKTQILNISSKIYVHAPVSLQYAYSESMIYFVQELRKIQKLISEERSRMAITLPNMEPVSRSTSEPVTLSDLLAPKEKMSKTLESASIVGTNTTDSRSASKVFLPSGLASSRVPAEKPSLTIEVEHASVGLVPASSPTNRVFVPSLNLPTLSASLQAGSLINPARKSPTPRPGNNPCLFAFPLHSTKAPSPKVLTPKDEGVLRNFPTSGLDGYPHSKQYQPRACTVTLTRAQGHRRSQSEAITL